MRIPHAATKAWRLQINKYLKEKKKTKGDRGHQTELNLNKHLQNVGLLLRIIKGK